MGLNELVNKAWNERGQPFQGLKGKLIHTCGAGDARVELRRS